VFGRILFPCLVDNHFRIWLKTTSGFGDFVFKEDKRL